MGLFNNGQKTRIKDIKASHVNGEISMEERDELLGEEVTTYGYIKMKYAGLAAICLIIAGVSF